ncbi:formylglycine-generating enzyme family protein [Bradyrhizobium oligotrophicum]|uniref:formylglycine-generating enzyme family protein n=1 Tax=Bradyrhizobium oligotrophicum TaxID=44255 RepID=UPI003EBAEBEE
MRIGINVLRPSPAPAPGGQERTLAAVSYPVPCDQCGRVVHVALSALRAPSFRDLAEQIACPEIQARRSKRDGLLMMMCGALKQSLAERCDRAEVEATAPVRGEAGRVVCNIPGVSTARLTPQEARSLAVMWQAHGQTKLAARLRDAAASAERRPLVRTGIAAGLVLLLLATAGSWLLLTRQPTQSPPGPPQTADAPVASPDLATAEPPQRAAMLQAVANAAAPATLQDVASTPAADEAPAGKLPGVAAAEAVPAPPTTQDSEASRTRLPDVVMIPGGSFAMGGMEAAELPVHRVTIKPFALGKYPVTIGEWRECVADKACADVTSGPDDNPVSNVSYEDAKDYLAWLSRTVGKPFRLPTEAEWEYAARAGASTKYWWGDQMRAGMVNCYGCNEAGAPPQLMKVGHFPANPFGLFDMGGSVDQWVADSWHKTYRGAPSDGSAWFDEQSFIRVIRSGSWKKDASYARSGSRDRYDGRIRYPTHGFRVALSL